MRVELAELCDAAGVMQTIALCVVRMRAQGIDQWDDIYPSLQIVEEDARARTLYIVRRDNLSVAAVCLNEVQSEQYSSLQWQCPTGRALVIHRLCVHPKWQRQGLARGLMDYTEHHARDHGYDCIRLDTYTGNPQALALYEHLGYRRIGQVWFPRRRLPFDCFEKVL